MNRSISIAMFISITTFMVVAMVVVVQFFGANDTKAERIATIMAEDKEEPGYGKALYSGVKQASEASGLSVIIEDDIVEGNGQVIDMCSDLLNRNVATIVLTSRRFPAECEGFINSNKDVAFYGMSNDISADNYNVFSLRVYQARYLAGVLAGLHSKSGRIGYVAPAENPEVIRDIDAFALGVRNSNPNATVYVRWSNSWNNDAIEKKAVRALIEDKKVDVVSYHQNEPSVIEEADFYGVESIGLYDDFTEEYEHCLTSVVCNWKKVFTMLLTDNSKDDISNSVRWLGLDKGAVDLSAYSSAVSDKEKLFVEAARARILSGNDVFTGHIKDNMGNERCKEGESITDEELFNSINWYAEGVEIYE
ncbi:MAG: BMP family ABC transporter substrate-binding protein [Lachnospiraceae bacterium]|nr:BMP family ABC transporter substrate-binding protein [Lachnospiraceae bacterium]